MRRSEGWAAIRYRSADNRQCLPCKAVFAVEKTLLNYGSFEFPDWKCLYATWRVGTPQERMEFKCRRDCDDWLKALASVMPGGKIQ